MTICIAHCVENEFSFVFNVEYYWRIFVYHLNTAIEAYFPVKRRSINARNKKKKAYPKNITQVAHDIGPILETNIGPTLFMILANIGVLHRTILANIGCWQWASILGQHCTNVLVMLGQCIGVDIGESILGRYCANICPILGQCTGVDIGEAILGRYCANIFLMLGQCTEFRYLGLDIVIYCIHIRAMPGQCIANEFNYQPILISS